MPQYRLMLSDDGCETFYHYHSYETARQAQQEALAIPDKDYQIIDARSNCVVLSGHSRPHHNHARGWLNYERK